MRWDVSRVMNREVARSDSHFKEMVSFVEKILQKVRKKIRECQATILII